ncbi:MAG: VOC family protein [Bacteroidetes bacterium]|nr:VOC family protein [Bacteroidota bacterium]
MKKVTGIGGVFFKCNNPEEIKKWYANNLGIRGDQYGSTFEWRTSDDPSKKAYTAWSAFAADTKYFEPSPKEFMINFRVADLDGLLAELKKEGIHQIGETITEDYGKFAHIMDPEGNKIELWEPVDKVFTEAYEGKTIF